MVIRKLLNVNLQDRIKLHCNSNSNNKYLY